VPMTLLVEESLKLRRVPALCTVSCHRSSARLPHAAFLVRGFSTASVLQVHRNG
jgi:hypothetical protein